MALLNGDMFRPYLELPCLVDARVRLTGLPGRSVCDRWKIGLWIVPQVPNSSPNLLAQQQRQFSTLPPLHSGLNSCYTWRLSMLTMASCYLLPFIFAGVSQCNEWIRTDGDKHQMGKGWFSPRLAPDGGSVSRSQTFPLLDKNWSERLVHRKHLNTQCSINPDIKMH